MHRDVGVRRQEGEGHARALRVLRGDGRRENERVGRAWVHVENEVSHDGRFVHVGDGDSEGLRGGDVVAAQVDGHHAHLELLQLLEVEQRGVLHHQPVRLGDGQRSGVVGGQQHEAERVIGVAAAALGLELHDRLVHRGVLCDARGGREDGWRADIADDGDVHERRVRQALLVRHLHLHHAGPVVAVRERLELWAHLVGGAKKGARGEEGEGVVAGLLLDGEGEVGVRVGVRGRQLVAHSRVERDGRGDGEVVGGLREGRRLVDVLEQDGEPPGGGGAVHVGHRHAKVPRLGLRSVLEVQSALLHDETARGALDVEPLVRSDGVLERLARVARVRIHCMHAGRQQLVPHRILLHVQRRRLCVEDWRFVHIQHLDGEHAHHRVHRRVGDGCGLHGEGDDEPAGGLVVHVLHHLHFGCVRGGLGEQELVGGQAELLAEQNGGEQLGVPELQRAVLQSGVHGEVLHHRAHERIDLRSEVHGNHGIDAGGGIHTEGSIASNHVHGDGEGQVLESAVEEQGEATRRQRHHTEGMRGHGRTQRNGHVIVFRIRHLKGRSDESARRSVWREEQVLRQRRNDRRLVHVQHSNVDRSHRLETAAISQCDLHDVLVHTLVVQRRNQRDSACGFINSEGGKVAALDALHRSVHAVVFVRVVHRADGAVHWRVLLEAKLVLEEDGRLIHVIHNDGESGVVEQRRVALVHHSDHHVEQRALLIVQRLRREQLARVGVDGEDTGVVHEEDVLLSGIPVGDGDVERDGDERGNALWHVDDGRLQVENGRIVVVDDPQSDRAHSRQDGGATVMHRHHEEVAGVSPEVERPRHGDRAVGRDGEVLHGAREGEGQRLLAQLHLGVKHLHPRHERGHRRPLIHPNGARVIRRHAHRRFVHVLHQHGESHLRRSARSVHRANHQRVVADSLVVQRSDREHAARLTLHREVRTACDCVEHHRTLVLRVHCDHRRTNTHVLLHSDSHGLFFKHGRTVAGENGHRDSSAV